MRHDGWHRAAVMMLLTVLAVILAWIDWRTSPNRTEVGHMAAGLYSWYTFRFDVFHANPPLIRAVATAPVAIGSPRTDWSPYSPAPLSRCEWALGNAFIKANDVNDVRWYFALARWACIPLSLLGGYITYRFSRDVFGKAAGLCALMLWCFSPMLLAWGATICPDIAAASLGITAAYVFWLWFCDPHWDRAVFAGVVLGLAELTKFTLVIFYPLWLAMWLVGRLFDLQKTSNKHRRYEVAQLLLLLVVSVLVINIGYGFEGSFRQLGDFHFHTCMMSGAKSLKDVPSDGANRFAGTWLAKLPVPLPANMVQGIDTQRYDFERGLPSYLRGQWADHGWWYYYLYALAIKEPLGTWCLVALAVVGTLLGRGHCASWRSEMVIFAPFLTVLVFVSSQTGFSVHSRYVIPAMPFLFTWASKAARVFERRPFTKGRQVMAAAVVVAIASSVTSSLSICPHSLSYFNELAAVLPTSDAPPSPPPAKQLSENRGFFPSIHRALASGVWNAPRHLLDSNIDWGQDLFYLKDWLDVHPDVKLDGFACDGLSSATLAGVAETPLPLQSCSSEVYSAGPSYAVTRNAITTQQPAPKPGWYALSVNYIYDRSRQYRYFLNFQPVAMAGYSIYIYHITIDEANRVRKKLGLPALSEKGVAKEDAGGGGHG
ncbi:MAG: glycosyltransferase family 39 protein [Thermoguttaceae bacterium]